MALANRCILEFDNELLKVSGSVANIMRLAQNTQNEQTRNCCLMIGGCTFFDIKTYYNFWLVLQRRSVTSFFGVLTLKKNPFTFYDIIF